MIFSQAMTEIELIVPSRDMLPVTRLLANRGIFHQTDASHMNSQTGVESTILSASKPALFPPWSAASRPACKL